MILKNGTFFFTVRSKMYETMKLLSIIHFYILNNYEQCIKLIYGHWTAGLGTE